MLFEVWHINKLERIKSITVHIQAHSGITLLPSSFKIRKQTLQGANLRQYMQICYSSSKIQQLFKLMDP